MKKTTLFVGILILVELLCGKFSFAQGEANFWYFGSNAGLDFNGGAPAAVTNGMINTIEGCASISDAAGNLLFYTDGRKVWNSNHIQMPNGFGLMGDPSSTQSAVIIQKPGSVTIYYIFTTPAVGGADGIRYTEVNMSLIAGLGDVTTNKNILLNTPSCEKITGIRHCNNKDIWVVTHDWNASNAFRTYLVTAAGVNSVPVISNAGLIVNGTAQNTYGHLKGSPDGKKLASAICSPIDRFELFDFDNSTGIVSNAILFPQSGAIEGAYGVEFSPDGTKLYGVSINPGEIYQFDLCAGSNTAIQNSGVLVATSSSPYVGSLQLGPDKKIYLSRFLTPWVGVINSPNTLGVGCNYVDNGVSLAGKNSYLGLPNFVSYYFKQALPTFTVSGNCQMTAFTAPTITACSGSANTISSVIWDFSDPASAGNNTSTLTNPTHTFTSAGTYTVSLVLNYTCGNDTLRQSVVVNTGSTNTINPTTCTTYTHNGQSYTNSGVYTQTLVNAAGCDSVLTINLTKGNPINTSGNPIICLGQSFIIHGQSQNASGIYTQTYIAVSGCDSISTITLTINNNSSSTINPIACNAYIHNSQAYFTGGIYTQTLPASNGCDSILTINLTINDNTNTSGDQNICQGQSATIHGISQIVAGVYTQTLFAANGCDSVSSITLNIDSSPPIDIGNDTTIAGGQSITLAITPATGNSYQWSTGETTSIINKQPSITTTYILTVTNSNGCSSMDTIRVFVENPCDKNTEIFIPNSFSPNGDGQNDALQLYATGKPETISFTIYNRWGEKVFESNDLGATWDGEYRRKPLDTAVFTYLLKTTCKDMGETIRKGNISLIR